MTDIDYIYNTCYNNRIMNVLEVEKRNETIASLNSAQGERMTIVHEAWQNVNLDDVMHDMNSAQRAAPDATAQTAGAVILMPRSVQGDYDQDKTIVLSLPYLNGYKPHHHIRARVMQEYIAPESAVVVLPNGKNDYDLKAILNLQGSEAHTNSTMTRFGEMQMRTLESISAFYPLGNVALSGYSQGALSSMAMVAAGSDRLHVTHVNADEMPSSVSYNEKHVCQERSLVQLGKDFAKSGGDLIGAIKDAEVPALSEVMNKLAIGKDVAKFLLKIPATYDGRILAQAMSGSARKLVSDAVADNEGVNFKVGSVEGSTIFEPLSIGARTREYIDIVEYYGSGLHKHASADQVRNHALFVQDGLKNF